MNGARKYGFCNKTILPKCWVILFWWTQRGGQEASLLLVTGRGFWGNNASQTERCWEVAEHFVWNFNIPQMNVHVKWEKKRAICQLGLPYDCSGGHSKWWQLLANESLSTHLLDKQRFHDRESKIYIFFRVISNLPLKWDICQASPMLRRQKRENYKIHQHELFFFFKNAVAARWADPLKEQIAQTEYLHGEELCWQICIPPKSSSQFCKFWLIHICWGYDVEIKILESLTVRNK